MAQGIGNRRRGSSPRSLKPAQVSGAAKLFTSVFGFVVAHGKGAEMSQPSPFRMGVRITRDTDPPRAEAKCSVGVETPISPRLQCNVVWGTGRCGAGSWVLFISQKPYVVGRKCFPQPWLLGGSRCLSCRGSVGPHQLVLGVASPSICSLSLQVTSDGRHPAAFSRVLVSGDFGCFCSLLSFIKGWFIEVPAPVCKPDSRSACGMMHGLSQGDTLRPGLSCLSQIQSWVPAQKGR